MLGMELEIKKPQSFKQKISKFEYKITKEYLALWPTMFEEFKQFHQQNILHL